jgi:hypothetical protein
MWGSAPAVMVSSLRSKLGSLLVCVSKDTDTGLCSKSTIEGTIKQLIKCPEIAFFY